MYKKKWTSVSEYESLAAADMTPQLPRQLEILGVKYLHTHRRQLTESG
jgi:hypothetical protein